MRSILIIILVSLSVTAYSQPGVANVVEQNGVRFYEHKVESGNTLWGLQRMYNVSVDDILTVNPALKDGLNVDQIVLIPAGKVKTQEIETVDYSVKKKETLYGLSRKFNVSVDDLIGMNPELADGLKKGQVIKVPSSASVLVESDVIATDNPFVIDTVTSEGVREEVTISFSDSTVRHTVMSHETMYSISKRFMVSISKIMEMNHLTSTSLSEGQVLLIPVKKERIERVDIGVVRESYDPEGNAVLEFEVKTEYKVALLLPFHLDYTSGYSEYLSSLSTQFYMGASMALDSLKDKGLNAKVYFFDTKSDSAEIAKIMGGREFLNMDLVIGPLMSGNMKMVTEFCKQNKIRVVTPVASDAGLLEGNRLVYSGVGSNISLMNGMASYMLANYSNDRIILVKPTDEKSLPLYEAFRKSFNQSGFVGDRPSLIETTIDGFNTYIKRGVNTRFVVPTIDKRTASKFMKNLNRSSFRSKADDLFVYGTKEWINFTDINDVYKNKYNFHYATSNMEDYYSDLAIDINKEFRVRYKTDMSKFSMQAYDVVTYFCNYFFLGNESSNLLMNDFQMSQVSEADGYENIKIFMVEQEEYELLKVGESE
ncbi:MAG: LysM peptidoglycan-binding domain-containing protein [Crocinitomicaceae bacterium]|nr:LysM peptidoglycan-binding domain-containing protein [Crocinitomicaceae bacterium]